MKENILDTLSIIISSALTITQTNELFRLISFILTILTSILVLVSKIVTWYKSARADGKITSDEMLELIDTTKNSIDEIKKSIDDNTDQNNE